MLDSVYVASGLSSHSNGKHNQCWNIYPTVPNYFSQPIKNGNTNHRYTNAALEKMLRFFEYIEKSLKMLDIRKIC